MGAGSVALYVAGGISEDWAKVILKKLPSTLADKCVIYEFLFLHGYVQNNRDKSPILSVIWLFNSTALSSIHFVCL